LDTECEKKIKKIMAIMTSGAQTAIIPGEGNRRNKSRYVWYLREENKIKVEIGSTIRPDPYSKKSIKTYIQEFLENNGFTEELMKFELVTVEVNVLNIERTFVDKLMSVKRHALGALHKNLLYTDEKQDLGNALKVFELIDQRLQSIGE
ncbi:MAG TPA: hypothetical protein DD640_08665, partial [Clostridiales bacterium]|nr:hypothetical protein [Clostridiales bacterium]